MKCLTLFVIAFLVAAPFCLCRKTGKCDQRIFEKCLSDHNYNSRSLQLVHYEATKEVIDDICRAIKDDEKCIRDFVNECHVVAEIKSPELRKYADNETENLEPLCTEGHPAREEFLRHSECLRQVKPSVEKVCIGNTPDVDMMLRVEPQNLIQLSNSTFKWRVCCLLDLREQCRVVRAQSECGQETADFMVQNIEKVEERARIFFNQECTQALVYNSQQCSKVLPEELVQTLTQAGTTQTVSVGVIFLGTLLAIVTSWFPF